MVLNEISTQKEPKYTSEILTDIITNWALHRFMIHLDSWMITTIQIWLNSFQQNFLINPHAWFTTVSRNPANFNSLFNTIFKKSYGFESCEDIDSSFWLYKAGFFPKQFWWDAVLKCYKPVLYKHEPWFLTQHSYYNTAT